MDKIAICLLTCDRSEITKRTLRSMKKYLDLKKFILLHGDDASQTDRNDRLAARAGFKTVVKSVNRVGVSTMWAALVQAAKDSGAEWVLMQENDWEWQKPLTVEEIEKITGDEDVYYVRFFGKYKENGGRKAGELHAAKGWSDPQWEPYISGWEIGDIHWGFPSNLTRIREAVKLTRGAKSENCARQRSGMIDKKTLRPLENYVFHIGENRTGGFKA